MQGPQWVEAELGAEPSFLAPPRPLAALRGWTMQTTLRWGSPAPTSERAVRRTWLASGTGGISLFNK